MARDLLGWRRPAQQLRQLSEVRRHAAGLVLGQPVGRRAALRLIVKIEIAERLPVRVFDDEALGVLLDHPRRREAARGRRAATASKCPRFPAQRASPSGPLDTPLIRSQ
jgi:hypothetical protein